MCGLIDSFSRINIIINLKNYGKKNRNMTIYIVDYMIIEIRGYIKRGRSDEPFCSIGGCRQGERTSGRINKQPGENSGLFRFAFGASPSVHFLPGRL